MDTLIDVFYYDYILSKIIKMYEENAPIEMLVSYLKAATILSRKFRIEKITPLDTQLCLKEAYVKILQLLRMGSTENCSIIEKVFDCFTTLKTEYSLIENESAFVFMKVALLCIYEKRHGSSKENNETCELKAQKLMSELGGEHLMKINELTIDYSPEKVIKYIKSVLKFDNPVMTRFAGFIKKEIDNDRKITTGNSPGTRIGW